MYLCILIFYLPFCFLSPSSYLRDSRKRNENKTETTTTAGKCFTIPVESSFKVEVYLPRARHDKNRGEACFSSRGASHGSSTISERVYLVGNRRGRRHSRQQNSNCRIPKVKQTRDNGPWVPVLPSLDSVDYQRESISGSRGPRKGPAALLQPRQRQCHQSFRVEILDRRSSRCRASDAIDLRSDPCSYTSSRLRAYWIRFTGDVQC